MGGREQKGNEDQWERRDQGWRPKYERKTEWDAGISLEKKGPGKESETDGGGSVG